MTQDKTKPFKKYKVNPSDRIKQILFDHFRARFSYVVSDEKAEILMTKYADQEKRKAFNEALDLANPNEEFLYSKELNEKRIKAYKLLGETYNISESSVADIFCKGIDFAKREIKQSILKLKV